MITPQTHLRSSSHKGVCSTWDPRSTREQLCSSRKSQCRGRGTRRKTCPFVVGALPSSARENLKPPRLSPEHPQPDHLWRTTTSQLTLPASCKALKEGGSTGRALRQPLGIGTVGRSLRKKHEQRNEIASIAARFILYCERVAGLPSLPSPGSLTSSRTKPKQRSKSFLIGRELFVVFVSLPGVLLPPLSERFVEDDRVIK